MTGWETSAAGLGSGSPAVATWAPGSIGFPIRMPLLSRGSADRSEDLREPSRFLAAWPEALVLVVDPVGRVATDESSGSPILVLHKAFEFGAAPPTDAVLLGRIAAGGGLDVWATSGEVTNGSGLRELAAVLPDTDTGLLTSAVAVLGWHRADPFCPRCGAPNAPGAAGWSRHCPNGHQEFPRSDPAVIMLVHDGADRMVLARQPTWPAGRVSVLAGFVEAGESLEGTVEREIGEEVGVKVRDIGYLGSQPWPFPRSLMVGFAARAEPGAVLRPRAGEIEEASWVDRATVRRVLAAGGEAEGIGLPGEVSIARRMIEGWVDLG